MPHHAATARQNLQAAVAAHPHGWSCPAAAADVLSCVPPADVQLRSEVQTHLRLTSRAAAAVVEGPAQHGWVSFALRAAALRSAADPETIVRLLGDRNDWLLDGMAAGNPALPAADAADLLHAGLASFQSVDGRDTYIDRAVAPALECRPALPLPAATLTHLLAHYLPGRHLLIARVVAARHAAGLKASDRMLFPSNMDGLEARRRAASVVSLLASPAPPSERMLHVAARVGFDAGQWPVLLRPLLDALRSDVLTEGPDGQRPRLTVVAERFADNLDRVPQSISGPLADPLAAAAAAACRPDRLAAAAVGPLTGTDDTGADAGVLPLLNRGLPWWPHTYGQTAERFAGRVWDRQGQWEAGRVGYLPDRMLDRPADHDHSAWLKAAGHDWGPDGRSLPTRIVDLAGTPSLSGPPAMLFVHELHRYAHTGQRSSTLDHFTTVDTPETLPGVTRTVAALLADMADGVPRSHLVDVVNSSRQPGQTLTALSLVA